MASEIRSSCTDLCCQFIEDMLAYIKVFIVDISPNLKFLMNLVDDKLVTRCVIFIALICLV